MEFKECPDVRLAEPEDIPEIMRLMEAHVAEADEGPISKEKAVALLASHFNKNGGIIGVVGDQGEKLHGQIILALQQNWWNDEYKLGEYCLFVDPDSRKSTYAKQLMIFAKKASEVLEVELKIGVWSNTRTEAKISLYKRQFKLMGAFFSHNGRENTR